MSLQLAAGLRALYIYRKDSSGFFQAGIGAAAPANGNQDGEAPYRLYLAKTMPAARTSGQTLTATGDDGTGPSFKFASNENASGTFTLAGQDPVADAVFQGTNRVTLADTSIVIDTGDPGDFDPESVGMIMIRRAKDRTGTTRWNTRIYPDVEIEPLSSEAQEQTLAVPSYGFTISKATVAPWGETLTAATYGTSSRGYIDLWDDYPLMIHRWNGDGTETQFNLPLTPIAAGANVWLNATIQALTTNYTIDTANDRIDAVSAWANDGKAVSLYRFESTDLD